MDKRKMELPNNGLQPKDQKIDKRTIVLGVVGFSLLAVVLFSLGMYCIGPMMRSRTKTSQDQQPTQASTPSSIPAAPAPKPEPALQAEVTERTGTATADTTKDQPSDVTQDGNTLTFKMNPADTNNSADNGTQTPEAQPSSTSNPERPSSQPHAKPPLDHAAVPSASDGTLYKVRAGTFANRGNADQLAANLRSDGYSPEIVSIQMQNNSLYRVETGSFKTQEDAQKLAKTLSAKGYSPSVVQAK